MAFDKREEGHQKIKGPRQEVFLPGASCGDGEREGYISHAEDAILHRQRVQEARESRARCVHARLWLLGRAVSNLLPEKIRPAPCSAGEVKDWARRKKGTNPQDKRGENGWKQGRNDFMRNCRGEGGTEGPRVRGAGGVL